MESVAFPTMPSPPVVRVGAEALDCVTTALLGVDLDFGEGVVTFDAALVGVEVGVLDGCVAGVLVESGFAKMDVGELEGVGLVVSCSTKVPLSFSSESDPRPSGGERDFFAA